MSNYIHGSLPEEQARLTKLNELINERCLKLLDVQPGYRVLDIGSGLGQFTLAAARLAGKSGKCLGIERDENQLKGALRNLQAARISWAEFRKGNAEELQLTGSEWESFDIAHARFVIEHVRHPDRVIAGMVKAVKRGGKVVLEDDDHVGLTLYPEPDGFAALWQAYIQSYYRIGNDPLIGRKLVSLLHRHGLRNIRNNVVFFGDNAGTDTFLPFVDNTIHILKGVQELLISESLVTEFQFRATIDRLREWSALPDAAMWYTIYWAAGQKSAE